MSPSARNRFSCSVSSSSARMIGTSRLSSSSVALPSAEAARTFRTASLKFSLAMVHPKDTARKKFKQDGGEASIALDKDHAVWHSLTGKFGDSRFIMRNSFY